MTHFNDLEGFGIDMKAKETITTSNSFTSPPVHR